jgi:FixJ family two-component response regulator
MSFSEAPNREVFIVDDDASARELLEIQFAQAGFHAATFEDGPSVVAAARARTPVCIILDMYMPGDSGLDVLDQIDAWNYAAPIFVNSGRGDIGCAVEAIKRGAFDFYEKSRGGEALIALVRAAIDTWGRRRQQHSAAQPAPQPFPGAASLTPREHEVLTQIVSCASNKEAALKLGISRRTVEIHRAHIMQKLGAKNSVDLVRIVLSKTPGASPRRLTA